MLEQGRLRELFDYHPDGYLIRRIRVGCKSPAGVKHAKIPYLRVKVDKRDYYLHQVIFVWHHGYLPAMIDHDDRDKQNNRVGNLLDSDPEHNGNNRGPTVRNLTGVKGVFVEGSKFKAQRTVKGKAHYLGLFPTIADAAEALRLFDEARQ